MAQLLITNLKKALDTLERSLIVTRDESKLNVMEDNVVETLRAGVVQNFEVAYELCWKYMKRWLGENVGKSYVEGVPRYELFRLAAENKLIENVEDWMGFHKLRNETSHTYDVATADHVFSQAEFFYKTAMQFYKQLELKNA